MSGLYVSEVRLGSSYDRIATVEIRSTSGAPRSARLEDLPADMRQALRAWLDGGQ